MSEAVERRVYRVHTTITYPEGHPVREKAIRDAGQYWKEREINQTKWDIVVAPGCEEAMRAARRFYTADGAEVKRIHSINHIGDVSFEG